MEPPVNRLLIRNSDVFVRIFRVEVAETVFCIRKTTDSKS